MNLGYLILMHVVVLICFGCVRRQDDVYLETDTSGSGFKREFVIGPTFVDSMSHRNFSHEFSFTNATKETVEGQLLSRSCGCTDCIFVPDAVRPGESGKIVVSLPFSQGNGERTETVLVKLAKSTVTCELTVKTRVPIAWKSSTDEVISAQPGDYANEVFELDINDKGKSVPISVYCDDPRVEVSLVEPTNVSWNEGVRHRAARVNLQCLLPHYPNVSEAFSCSIEVKNGSFSVFKKVTIAPICSVKPFPAKLFFLRTKEKTSNQASELFDLKRKMMRRFELKKFPEAM